MDASSLMLLQRELRRFESMCDAAIRQIARARTLAEVSRLASAHPPALIRHLPEARRSQAKLARAGADRADALVEGLVARYATADPEAQVDQAGEIQAALRQLQGRFPRQYVVLDRAHRQYRKNLTAQ